MDIAAIIIIFLLFCIVIGYNIYVSKMQRAYKEQLRKATIYHQKTMDIIAQYHHNVNKNIKDEYHIECNRKDEQIEDLDRKLQLECERTKKLLETLKDRDKLIKEQTESFETQLRGTEKIRKVNNIKDDQKTIDQRNELLDQLEKCRWFINKIWSANYTIIIEDSTVDGTELNEVLPDNELALELTKVAESYYIKKMNRLTEQFKKLYV